MANEKIIGAATEPDATPDTIELMNAVGNSLNQSRLVMTMYGSFQTSAALYAALVSEHNDNVQLNNLVRQLYQEMQALKTHVVHLTRTVQGLLPDPAPSENSDV